MQLVEHRNKQRITSIKAPLGAFIFIGITMSNSLWLAFGLVLIVEGLGPLIAPNGWRTMVAQLSQQPDTQLRRIGGCLVVVGAVIAYVFS